MGNVLSKELKTIQNCELCTLYKDKCEILKDNEEYKSIKNSAKKKHRQEMCEIYEEKCEIYEKLCNEIGDTAQEFWIERMNTLFDVAHRTINNQADIIETKQTLLRP